jgi:hypothetical protein
MFEFGWPRVIPHKAYGRAYGTVRSQSSLPYLQHWPSACWGLRPQTPGLSTAQLNGIYSSLLIKTHHLFNTNPAPLALQLHNYI